MPRVTCHMSGVRCRMFVNKQNKKMGELIVGGSVINGAIRPSFYMWNQFQDEMVHQKH